MASNAVSLDQLQTFLNGLLHSDRFKDYCPNGLQVEGRDHVAHIATACSASKAAIEAAIAAGANALIVHHGILWGKSPSPITGMMKGRLAPLLAADCSLFGYHLPLDAHPEYGNNAVVLRALGCDNLQPFAAYYGNPIGFYGSLPEAIPLKQLIQQLGDLVQHEVLHCPGAGDMVQQIGIVTGGGQSSLLEAADLGCDVFISGEASEQTWHEALESGCHCLAAGHHATESIAIHRLGEFLAETFGVQHSAIEIANPV